MQDVQVRVPSEEFPISISINNDHQLQVPRMNFKSISSKKKIIRSSCRIVLHGLQTGISLKKLSKDIFQGLVKFLVLLCVDQNLWKWLT